MGAIGELARFAEWDERLAQFEGERRGEQEASGFGRGYGVHLESAIVIAHSFDGVAEGARFRQKGGDVFEQDAGFGEIRYIAYVECQIHVPSPSWDSGRLWTIRNG